MCSTYIKWNNYIKQKKKARETKEKIEDGKKGKTDNSDRKFSRAQLRNCAAVNTKRTIRWVANGRGRGANGNGRKGGRGTVGCANDNEPRGERSAGNRRIVLLNY